MKLDNNTGLVLEGGGMRGVFTCGVLDAFMKHNMYFNYVVAVSAGAGNGMSYMSRQPGRARVTNIDYMDKFHFIGLRYLLTQGCIFDAELLYDKVPNEYVPFDYDAYFNNPATFEMVTTNCLTGRPMYLTERHDRQRALDVVRASASLPYVCKITNVDGIPMLDGGIVDSIPVERAMATGHAQMCAERARADAQPRLSQIGSRHKDSAFHIQEVSASARGTQPSYARLQRAARAGGASGGRGQGGVHSPRTPDGGRPHGEGCSQVAAALRGRLRPW